MAQLAGRERGRGRGRGEVGSHLETITWPGSFGPEQYFAPVYEFLLEERHAFAPPNRLRE